MKRCLSVAVFGALCAGAAAQQPPAAPVRAADPAAQVPPASYRSAFEGYVPYREQALAPWRELNDDVARASGHVGILRSGGHAGGERGSPAKAAPGQGAGSERREPAGQAPARAAPKAPAGGHHGH